MLRADLLALTEEECYQVARVNCRQTTGTGRRIAVVAVSLSTIGMIQGIGGVDVGSLPMGRGTRPSQGRSLQPLT